MRTPPWIVAIWLWPHVLPAQPDWEAVKAATQPEVVLPDEFGTPYRLSLSTGGWEDGLYITRDGLNLYCIYLPADVFSLLYVGNGDITHFSAYRRGPTFGMDLTTNPIGASEWLHGDILYSHRRSLQDSFPGWILSRLARPVWSEGAVQIIMENDSTADLFAYTSNHDSPPDRDDVDILVFRHTSLNPAGAGEFIPEPVRTDFKEDNPHFERLDDSTLVLFYDSDRPGGAGGLDLWYAISRDDGSTWSEPRPVSSINTSGDDQMPHLFRDDTGTWFLYFATPNPATGQLEIQRARLQTDGDWNSWSSPERVLGPGNAFAVGEPTLTGYGDMAFVLVYDAGASATPTDRFDADPWFLPRKGSPTAVSSFETIPLEARLYPNYPNPFNPQTTLRYYLSMSARVELAIFDLAGRRVRTLVAGFQTAGEHHAVWNGRNDLGVQQPSGVYLYRLKAGRITESGRMIYLR